MRRVFLMMLVVACLMPGRAIQAALEAPLDTSNPVATYRSFLAETHRIEGLFQAYRRNPTYANEARIGRAMIRLGTTVFDLRDLPAATRIKHAATGVGYLADILNRLPEYTGNPPSGDPPARWTLPGTEIRLVRLTDGPRAGDYVFSAQTLASLPTWHAEIIGEPVLRAAGTGSWRRAQQRATGPLLSLLPLGSLPEALQLNVGETPIWKAILTVLSFLLVLALIVLWGRRARLLARNLSPWKAYAVALTVPGLCAALVSLAYAFIVLEIIPTGVVSDGAMLFAITLLFMAAAWAAWLVWWLIAEVVIASSFFPDDIYDANLIRLVARVGSLLSAGGLIMLGANEIGIPALGLLAGVSIGGVALALAAQSTVENLFGGVSIFADRPFRVGDTIAYGSATGQVVAIGPRSSRIRASDGRVTTVPNADLAKMHVTNISARDRWTFQHRIGANRTTPRAKIVALLDDVQRKLEAHASVAQLPGWPRVRLVGVNDAALEIEVAAQILTADEASFLAVQQELILMILQAMEEADIRSPSEEAPTQATPAPIATSR